MYFKVFRVQSRGKKTAQDKTGVFRGALMYLQLKSFKALCYNGTIQT